MPNKTKNASVNTYKGKPKKEMTKKKKVMLIVVIAVVSLCLILGITLLVVDLVDKKVKENSLKSSELESSVVGTCNGYDVKYEELRFVAGMYKTAIERKYGEGAWEDEENRAKYEAELEERVMSNIKNNYVIMTLYNEFYGDPFKSKEAAKYVDEKMDEMIDDELGGFSEYKAFLEENQLTDSLMRFMLWTDYLESAVINAMINDKGLGYIKYNDENVEEFCDYVLNDDDYARIIYIYYPIDTTKGANNSKALKEMQGYAEDLKKITDDDDRYKKMCTYIGRVPYVEGYSINGKAGVYFTHGQMGDDIENVSFALELYETSDVLTTDDGYYIIMKLEKEESYIFQNLPTLLSYYHNVKLNMLEEERKESFEFVPNEFYGTLKLSELE